MRLMTCEMCGKQEMRHESARFCFECAQERNRENTRQAARRRAAGLLNVKQCKLCGKEFIPTGNRRYCSDECAAIAAKDRYRDYQHRYYLRRHRKEGKKK